MSEHDYRHEFIELEPIKYSLKLKLNKRKTKEIILCHGHIIITDYNMGDNWEFEKSLSVWSKTNYKYFQMGYYYIKELKEMRVNRGYDLRMLRRFFPDRFMRVENDAYPSEEIDVDLYAEPNSDFQKVALTFLTCNGMYKGNKNFTQAMITAATGSGKAMPDDSMIPTPDGYRRFDSLKPGDYVYTPSGDITNVLDVYPQVGLQKTFKLTFTDGRTARCNPEHLWKVSLDCKSWYVLSLEDFIDRATDFYIPMPGLIATTVFNTNSDSTLEEEANFYRSRGMLATITKDEDGILLNARMSEWGEGLKIIKVEEIEPTMQRCIRVDSSDHMYLAENFVPTHNTYLATATTAYYHARTVVFCPISKLLSQWKQSYMDFTSLEEDEIMIVQGSDSCEKIRKGKCHHVKVFIFMVDTIVAYTESHGALATIDMLRETGAYLKFIDEIHKDLKAVSMIEALSNFKHSIYLSASPGRTENKENWIFNTLFYNVPKFGADFQTQDELHINMMIKKYYWLPNSKQINRIINPRVGMNTRTYEKELVTSTPEARSSFDDALRTMLKWSKGLLVKGNKILILAQTITFIEYIRDIAEEVFPGETALYHGSLKPAEKEEALTHTVIIATTSSLGTGTDIKGLQHCYNCGTYSGKIDAVQISGRLRKLKDDKVQSVYVELVNFGYMKTAKQFDKRKPYLIKRSKTGKLIIVN